jgi:hypothetical protein
MATKKKVTEEDGAPNVQYVRRRRQLNKETGKMKVTPVAAEDVPTFRKDGEMEFKLPSGEEQLKGFYHPEAARLMRAWPKDFKRPGKGRVVRDQEKTEGGEENE